MLELVDLARHYGDQVALDGCSFRVEPLVMPIRLARGQIAPWESTMALLLTIAAIYALVRLGGRVYAGALLHTGGKMRPRDAWRVGGAEIPSTRREPLRT